MKLNKKASLREFLSQRPTLELDEMLQAELHKENIDDDMVRLILDILEEREADCPVEIDESISLAVEKFASYEEASASTQPSRKTNRLLKVASILLVVELLLFAVPQVANAENIFDVLVRWTDSVFEFFSPGDHNEQPEYVFTTDHPGLQQIYDAVAEMGVTEPVVPMWVPDGYVLDELKVFMEPSESSLYARMKCNDREISVSINKQSEKFSINHMKDTENIEIIEVMGIEYYIISNNEKTNAIWVVENIECSVVTDCQEDIYRILKSIYTTEVQ